MHDEGVEFPETTSPAPRRALGDLLHAGFGQLRSGSLAEHVYTGLTLLLFGYALLQAFKAYALGFDRPLIGHHEFRQAQTALSALTIAKGGPWFAYETPLFGAPYAVPFEFPLYQWLVALLHQIGHVKLDQAGRLVSIAFFLLALLPLFRLLRNLGFSVNSALLTLSLLLVAPEYLFWTRTFMIESTALCLSIAALDAGVEAMKQENPSRQQLLLVFLWASLAMLVKITTAVIYLGILGALLAQRFLATRDRRERLRSYGVLAASGLVVPTLLALLWTRFADNCKDQNALTATFLTSRSLHAWTHGTWQQRADPQTWRLLWDRTTVYTFGSGATLITGLVLALFGTRRLFALLVCITALLGGFLSFTNLHLVHDYYQYATSALAVVIVGFGLAAAETWTRRGRLLLPLLVAAMVAASVTAYRGDYERAHFYGDMNTLAIGKYVQRHTAKDALMVVYGDDWSGVLPYYARRKSLMDRWSYGPNHPDVKTSLAKSAERGHAVGAVLFCHHDRAFGDGRAETLLGHAPQCAAVGHCDVCL